MTAAQKLTLGMEPSERRALEIIRLASEQADEIERLQKALDEMTTRCHAAEYGQINGHYLFSPTQLLSYVEKCKAAWEISRGHGQKALSLEQAITEIVDDAEQRHRERALDYWNALGQVVQWWESLPPSLRQDIEGSGSLPGCIAKAKRLSKI